MAHISNILVKRLNQNLANFRKINLSSAFRLSPLILYNFILIQS